MSITPIQSRGFTLIEVLVSMAIFALIMVITADVFGRTVRVYGYTHASQRAAEDLHFAMSRIGKSLRTGSVAAVSSSAIVVYDYSRGQCVRYAFASNAITEQTVTMSDMSGCGANRFSGVSATPLTESPITSGAFTATTSRYDPPRVGRVTMTVTATPSRGAAVHMQTSVSLRDYDVSGLM